MNEGAFRCGTAAILGRPNVGKSTLLNALVGERVSIVTPRPHTTRHRILGVVTKPEGSIPGQILFLDTPGMHAQAKRAMNRGDGVAIVLRSPGILPVAAADGPCAKADGSEMKIGVAECVQRL